VPITSRPKLSELLGKIEELSLVVERAAKESKLAADEASHGMAQSYSVAGDVEHARNTANLSLEKAKQVKKLKEEIEASLNTEVPTAVGPVCFASLEFDDGSKKDIYVVENPVFVSGFSLISINSPLGKTLKERKVGEPFSYESSSQSFKGKILGIG
jgi:transcription elongation GreA/GreB family factor